MAATELIKLNLKLTAGAKPKSKDWLADVPGVQSVIQTFPDENDEELARLYVLEVKASDSDAVLKNLTHHAEVEYVERTAPRRLLRPNK